MFYGFDGVVTKMLTKLGALSYRRALNDGCHLLIGERPFPSSFAMKVMFKENTGARYEHDELGVTTEEPGMIAKMQEKRNRKKKAVADYLMSMHTVNVYGNTGPVILTYGSTTMSVLEALKCGEIDAKVVQPVYLEPLPVWELEKYRDGEVIIVELSCEGQFASLLKEKVGIEPKSVIKKYDGRPFDPLELSARIKEVI